jgi:hypothetical protein
VRKKEGWNKYANSTILKTIEPGFLQRMIYVKHGTGIVIIATLIAVMIRNLNTECRFI